MAGPRIAEHYVVPGMPGRIEELEPAPGEPHPGTLGRFENSLWWNGKDLPVDALGRRGAVDPHCRSHQTAGIDHVAHAARVPVSMIAARPFSTTM